MRARELLDEDYNNSLQTDVLDLLTQLKGNGVTHAKTRALVAQLRGMGYAVDENSILSLLSNNPMVMNATPDSVSITPPEGTDDKQAGQDPAEQVKDMAQAATDISESYTYIGIKRTARK